MSMPKKTYSEWITENPDFFTSRLVAGTIDEATVASINSWYTFRTLCDDEKFTVFFSRQLDLALPRYNKLVRFENTEFDALVNMYRERRTTGTGTESISEDIDKTKTSNDTTNERSTATRTPNITVTDDGTNTGRTTGSSTGTAVRTPNLTTTDNGTMSSTTDMDSSSSSSTTSGSGSTSMDASVSKSNPQSISYSSGFDSDGMPLLDWSYPSAQQQSKGKADSESTTSSTGTNNSDTTQSGTNSNTNVMSGTDTNETTGSNQTDENRALHNVNVTTGNELNVISGSILRIGGETETGSVDTSKTRSDLQTEQWTGRDQLTPQEALQTAMDYVKGSSAFVWLKEQLDVVFLSVYDV